MGVLATSSLLFWLVVVLGLMAAGGVAVLVLMIRVLRSSKRRRAEAALAPLRERVTTLMDRAESLKQRCDRLTGAADPAVPKPDGRTGALAAQAHEALDAVWEVWTGLHAVLEEAREKAEDPLDLAGTGFEKAAQLASDDDTRVRYEEAMAQAEAVAGMLDRLEEAPLRAVAAIEAAEARAGELRRGAATLEGDRRAPVDEAAGQAEAGLAAMPPSPWSDPIAVAERAEELRAALEAAGRDAGLELAPLPATSSPDPASAARGAQPGAREEPPAGRPPAGQQPLQS